VGNASLLPALPGFWIESSNLKNLVQKGKINKVSPELTELNYSHYDSLRIGRALWGPPPEAVVLFYNNNSRYPAFFLFELPEALQIGQYSKVKTTKNHSFVPYVRAIQYIGLPLHIGHFIEKKRSKKAMSPRNKINELTIWKSFTPISINILTFEL